MHTSVINDLPHVLNLGHTKSEFLQIGTQLVLLRCLEDLPNMVEVLLPTLVEDHNVIQVHSWKWVGERPQYVIPQPHEGCRSIFQPERHYQPFEKAFLGFEGSLPHIGWFNWYLVIPRLQVDIAEIFTPLSWSRRSSICGIGYLFRTVILFSTR